MARTNMKIGSSEKRFSIKSIGFTWFFAILSFIADIYTIGQIFSNTQISPPISPWLGVVVWTLAFFTYLSLLHGHWESVHVKQKYSSSFLGYFFLDLIFYFRRPFYLLPLVFLLLLFFPTVYMVDQTIIPCISVPLFGAVFVLIVLKLTNIMSQSHERSDEDISAEVMENIMKNWEAWEKRINLEFTRRYIVTQSDFTDITALTNYGMREFRFIFAVYSSKHAEKVVFGDLRKPKQSGEVYSTLIAINCLVEREYMDSRGYYVS